LRRAYWFSDRQTHVEPGGITESDPAEMHAISGSKVVVPISLCKTKEARAVLDQDLFARRCDVQNIQRVALLNAAALPKGDGVGDFPRSWMTLHQPFTIDFGSPDSRRAAGECPGADRFAHLEREQGLGVLVFL